MLYPHTYSAEQTGGIGFVNEDDRNAYVQYIYQWVGSDCRSNAVRLFGIDIQ